MANARNLIGLGMPSALANEIAAQIEEAATAAEVTVATFTTAGATEISGNLQEVLEEIADLADPA